VDRHARYVEELILVVREHILYTYRHARYVEALQATFDKYKAQVESVCVCARARARARGDTLFIFVRARRHARVLSVTNNEKRATLIIHRRFAHGRYPLM
jgi:hypothetical protein